jgi:hypothetical protein
MTPGTNRRATIFGALDLTTGAWFCLWARRSAAGFTAMLQMLLAAYPSAPAVAVICDHDGIHPRPPRRAVDQRPPAATPHLRRLLQPAG